MGKVYKPLSELGFIITGKTPKTDIVEYWDGTIPFITPTDINGYRTYYQSETDRTISKIGANKQKATLLPPNSVCVTCIGSTIGKSCLTKVASITNQQINSIVPNEENDYRYILYLIWYNLSYLQMIGGGSGSGTPIISKNKFAKFKFLVEENLEVQHRIASILSTYDTLIENNTKRIRLLEKMAENLYKEWFVRFRFPGHENVEMENGLPKGWKVEKLGNLSNISTGKCNREDAEEDGVYPLFDRSQETKRSSKWLKDCEAIIVPGEGTTFMPRYYVGKFNLHQRCYCVEPTKAQIGNFLFYTIMFNRKYFLSVATGATVPSLRYNNFAKMKIIVPSEELYSKFEQVVSKLFKEKDNLQHQNSLLARQRDLLLPRLMSGKLEVKEELLE